MTSQQLRFLTPLCFPLQILRKVTIRNRIHSGRAAKDRSPVEELPPALVCAALLVYYRSERQSSTIQDELRRSAYPTNDTNEG